MAWPLVGATGSESGPVASYAITPGWPCAAGDVVALAVWWWSGTGAITGTPSDTSGDGVPWNTLGQGCYAATGGGSYLSGAVYWKVMGLPGTWQYSVVNSASAYTSLCVLERTPPAGTVAGDGWASVAGVQDSAAGTYGGNALTTAGADDWVISLVNDATGNRTHAAATGYTLRVDLTNATDEPGAVEDQDGVAAGAITPAWTMGSCSGTGTFAIFSGALRVIAPAPLVYPASLLTMM